MGRDIIHLSSQMTTVLHRSFSLERDLRVIAPFPLTFSSFFPLPTMQMSTVTQTWLHDPLPTYSIAVKLSHTPERKDLSKGNSRPQCSAPSPNYSPEQSFFLYLLYKKFEKDIFLWWKFVMLNDPLRPCMSLRKSWDGKP